MHQRQLRPRQHGATLIEVLVSVLIVTLGIVAMAVLLAKSTQMAKASEFRSLASILAADMADRIKGNIAAAQAGNYNLTTSFSNSLTSIADPTTDCYQTGSYTACTAADMATYDLTKWRQNLLAALPLGQGYIQYDTSGKAIDLWVVWKESKATSFGLDNEYQDLDDKNCPASFKSNTDRPRCMYFRVGL